MKTYLLVAGLILITIGQVAWAPFLIVGGNVVPLVVIYLWLILARIDFIKIAVFAFVSGLIIDIMGSDNMALHAAVLLIVVGSMRLVEKHTIKNQVLAKVFSLVVGVMLYITGITFLQANL